MAFIPKNKVPFETNKVTYEKINCHVRPNKEETHRTRLTVGGNLLSYDGILTTPTATVTTAKLQINSILSKKKSKALILDIQNFYLNNNMPKPEYMKMHIDNIPQEIITQYNLTTLQDDQGCIYILKSQRACTD